MSTVNKLIDAVLDNESIADKKRRLTANIITLKRGVSNMQGEIARLTSDLSKLDEPRWNVTRAGRQKAYESLWRATDRDSPFFTDSDGTRARYDKLAIERTEDGLRVRFAHRGKEYVYVDAPGATLSKTGNTLYIEGVSGEIAIGYSDE